MRKRCKRCGCYLDPNEWCDCEDDAPEVDQPRRPVAFKPTVRPREWNSEAYNRKRWEEFDMR